MLRYLSFIPVLAMLLLGAPAEASEQGSVTKTFEVVLYGNVPRGEEFYVGVDYVPGGGTGLPPAEICGTPGRPECRGGGATNAEDRTFARHRGHVAYRFVRFAGAEGSRGEVFARGISSLDYDSTIRAYYDYNKGKGGFLGESGVTPQKIVRESFRLSLYGDVPSDVSFVVSYNYTPEPNFPPPPQVVLCGGDSGRRCEGGNIYTASRRVPFGSNIVYYFKRVSATGRSRVFAMGVRSLTEDETDSAWYRYGNLPNGLPETGTGGAARLGSLARWAALAAR